MTSRGNNNRILLVDDEDDILFILQQGLLEWGFESRGAHSVDEAIPLFRDWQPHYVVSDYSMPEKDGAVLFEHIKLSQPEFVEEGRFIFLTGNPIDIEDFAERHAIPLLVKPVSFGKLVGLLSTRTALTTAGQRPVAEG